MNGEQVIETEDIDALLLDMDGVVTKTMVLHAKAWKRMLDAFLADRAAEGGEPFRPFDILRDYRLYVDGKPRDEGLTSFLASRGITLPYGEPDDEPGHETVCGLGNRKNQYFHEYLAERGAEVYATTLVFIREARSRGLKVAVISSSKNCAQILDAAGIPDFFDARVDGRDVARLGLRGKPAPDIFREAARRVGVDPGRAIVVEDAPAGVEAARRGGFALVIGLDRHGRPETLAKSGAHIVVPDLGDVMFEHGGRLSARPGKAIPHALDKRSEIRRRFSNRRLAVFLDYDGTLTPIVEKPELAVLADDMRRTIAALARLCPVAVVSGRDRADVASLVGLNEVYYAGSHGLDIVGPDGKPKRHADAARYALDISDAEGELRKRLASIEGAIVEGKKITVAIHYRLVADDDVTRVKAAVEDVVANRPGLEITGGKKVFELRPRLGWDKGKAIIWLLGALDLDQADVTPIYIGDDRTDEDAFWALRDRGIGLLVASPPRPTLAAYVLRDPDDVKAFLRFLIDSLGETAR